MKRTLLRVMLLPVIVLALHHVIADSHSYVAAQQPMVNDPPAPVPPVDDPAAPPLPPVDAPQAVPEPQPVPEPQAGAANEAAPDLLPEVVEGADVGVPYVYGQQPDLFYNYYAAPQGGGVPAQMYIAPRPVPSRVGHTYYTYEPLYPHEYMYPHYREYYTYYGNYHQYGCANSVDSLNRTSVRYQRGNLSSFYYQPLFRHVPGMPKCIGGRCR